MAELIVVRHGQASFGSAQAQGYDRLSEQGEVQSRMVGATLKAAPSMVTRFSLEYEHDLIAGQFSGGATGTPELVHGPLEGGTESTLRRAFVTSS